MISYLSGTLDSCIEEEKIKKEVRKAREKTKTRNKNIPFRSHGAPYCSERISDFLGRKFLSHREGWGTSQRDYFLCCGAAKTNR